MTIDSPQTLFRGEYELEMENWLRRRFKAVCICYMALGVLVLLWRVLTMSLDGGGQHRAAALAINIVATGIALGVSAHYLFARHWTGATRDQLLRGASNMILILGTVSFIRGVAVIAFTGQETDFLPPLFFWHFIACLILPWTPRESLRPILPLLGAWALGVLLLDQGTILSRVLTVILGPAILIPGLGLCALRLQYHSESFRSRMVGKHFLTMRQEFARARSIHESMFPPPHDDGHARFEYIYTPMRELGGDYIHLHVGAEGLLHFSLIDVTGHGLAAALTVNRLFGELERIRGESPGAEPGEVLSLLNRYVNLTLVKHNIYVTALCATLDPYLGRLQWASAGHPPAFLRGFNGVVTRLPATAVLLGALDSGEFSPQQREVELSPGDVIVLYTDGAFEGCDRQGKQLGLDKLDALMHIQPAPRNWPKFLASNVETHTGGRTEDDVLIAAVTYLSPRGQTRHAPAQATLAAS